MIELNGIAAALDESAASGLFGAGASALVPRLPAGAIIVIIAGIAFAFSMVFGTARGILAGKPRTRTTCKPDWLALDPCQCAAAG